MEIDTQDVRTVLSRINLQCRKDEVAAQFDWSDDRLRAIRCPVCGATAVGHEAFEILRENWWYFAAQEALNFQSKLVRLVSFPKSELNPFVNPSKPNLKFIHVSGDGR